MDLKAKPVPFDSWVPWENYSTSLCRGVIIYTLEIKIPTLEVAKKDKVMWVKFSVCWGRISL